MKVQASHKESVNNNFSIGRLFCDDYHMIIKSYMHTFSCAKRNTNILRNVELAVGSEMSFILLIHFMPKACYKYY